MVTAVDAIQAVVSQLTASRNEEKLEEFAEKAKAISFGIPEDYLVYAIPRFRSNIRSNHKIIKTR